MSSCASFPGKLPMYTGNIFPLMRDVTMFFPLPSAVRARFIWGKIICLAQEISDNQPVLIFADAFSCAGHTFLYSLFFKACFQIKRILHGIVPGIFFQIHSVILYWDTFFFQLKPLHGPACVNVHLINQMPFDLPPRRGGVMLYSATKIKTADLKINAGIHYRKREQE